LKNYITFAHLIKDIVLGLVLWGANTFPTHNRLQNPKSCFLQTLSYLFGFSIVFHNKLWWQLQTLFFSNFTFGSPSRHDFCCDKL